MVDDARRQVINSRVAAKQREYRYRLRGYAIDSKKGEHTFSTLVKGTVRNLVSSRKLKQIYRKFLPSINLLVLKASNDVDRRAELRQLALIAIWSALCNHDQDTELPSGRLYMLIKQAIRHGYLEDAGNYSPKPSRTAYRKYNRAIKSYRKKYGCEPTNHQLADFMGVEPLYVQQFFIQQNYEGVTMDETEHSKSAGGYWQHKNDYEDRLIYWLDRHWVKGVLSQLGETSATVMKIKALGISARRWQRKHGFGNAYCCLQQKKTIEYARLLEQYNYRPSDGDPRQFLESKGYQTSKIWGKVLGKK